MELPDQPASLPPTTTSEENLRTAGQRQINRVWEYTQAAVAVAVTFTTLFVAGSMAIRGDGNNGAFLLLSNVFFLVIGTYFQRTNHTKIGGVGGTDSR
ncbi:MAG: hypothetical protein QOI07_910 [Verrucomicrobiota bacterium]|jgi:hypothetical protein